MRCGMLLNKKFVEQKHGKIWRKKKFFQVAVKLAGNRVYQACQQLEALIRQIEALADQFTGDESLSVEEPLDLAYQILDDEEIQCQEVECAIPE